MIVPRNLDLDWLHTAVDLIVSGRYRHRREGKTVAYLTLMLGEVELGGPHNNYLYVGETSTFTSYVQQEFVSLVTRTFPSATVVDQRTPNKVLVNAQQYFFHPIDLLIDRPHVVRTYALDRIFMDIDDGTQRKLDKTGRLEGLFRELLPVLSYRRGDVI